MSVPEYYLLTFNVTGETHDGYCSDPYEITDTLNVVEKEVAKNEQRWTAEQMANLDLSQFDHPAGCQAGSNYCGCTTHFKCIRIEPYIQVRRKK